MLENELGRYSIPVNSLTALISQMMLVVREPHNPQCMRCHSDGGSYGWKALRVHSILSITPGSTDTEPDRLIFGLQESDWNWNNNMWLRASLYCVNHPGSDK